MKLLVTALWMMIGLAVAAEVRPQSTLHVYRYQLKVHQASHPTVQCDTFPIVRMQNGRVYTMKVTAGHHTFTIADSLATLNVSMEPDKEYYVRMDYPETLGTGPMLTLVPPEQGRIETAKLKPLDGWYVENATCGSP